MSIMWYEMMGESEDPKFESKALPIDPKADVSKEHNWSLYFQCGYKGAFDSLNPDVIKMSHINV